MNEREEELLTALVALAYAANEVLNNWERGNLAFAVQMLGETLQVEVEHLLPEGWEIDEEADKEPVT